MTNTNWQEIEEGNNEPIVAEKKLYRERKPLLIIITSLLLVFTFMMTYSFSEDPPNLPIVLVLLVFAIISSGLLCATIFPRSSHWAYKFIALVILCSYLAYFTHETFFINDSFSINGDMEVGNGYGSLFGLLIYGIPAFIYLFFSKSINKLHEGGAEEINLLDYAVAKFIAIAGIPFFIIFVVAFIFNIVMAILKKL